MSRNIAKQNIEQHQKVSKSYHDQRSCDAEYVINDLVWVYNPEVTVGLSRKLRRMWLGPFRVSAIGPNHTYRLQKCETLEILTSLVNASRLKPVVGHQHSAIRQLANNKHVETQVGRLGANETNSSQPNARTSQNLVPSNPTGVSYNTSRARLRRKPGESPREFVHGIESLINLKLSPFLIPISTMKTTTDHVNRQLRHSQSELFVKDLSAHELYSDPKFHQTFTDSSIFITYYFPLTSAISDLTVYKVHTSPVPLDDNSSHVTILADMPPFIAFSNDQHYYTYFDTFPGSMYSNFIDASVISVPLFPIAQTLCLSALLFEHRQA